MNFIVNSSPCLCEFPITDYRSPISGSSLRYVSTTTPTLVRYPQGYRPYRPIWTRGFFKTPSLQQLIQVRWQCFFGSVLESTDGVVHREKLAAAPVFDLISWIYNIYFYWISQDYWIYFLFTLVKCNCTLFKNRLLISERNAHLWDHLLARAFYAPR